MQSGRPTKYDPKYCDELIEYFDKYEHPYREENDLYTYKDGSTKETYKEVANDLPTFAGFAAKIGVHRDTLDEWKKVHPIFSDSYARAKEIQENHLVQNALRGNYNSQFSIFFATNNLGYKDRKDTELTMKKDGAQELASALFDQSIEDVAEEDESDA